MNGAEFIEALVTNDLRWGWKHGRGYACPVCGSGEVARESLTTVRYPGRLRTVERHIRCMACGESESEAVA